jgi:DNA-binding PadR family transcriptional regulator
VSAKHALLGLLMSRPAYRYQLGDRLQERLGPAWRINSGQLYQTIDRLEDNGLIERVDQANDEQHERHVFAVTAAGAEEFDRWFDDTVSRARLLRRPLLVKITLAGRDRLRDTLAEIDAYEQDCAACLREHLRLREEIPLGGLRVRADHEMLRLNLSADIMQLEGELGWARFARERVSWLLEQDAIWPAAHARSDASKASQERQSARADLFGRLATNSDEPLQSKPNRTGQGQPTARVRRSEGARSR